LLYETTQLFLEHFGLRNLDELPNVEELRTRYLPVAPRPLPLVADAPGATEEAVTIPVEPAQDTAAPGPGD
jgi:segregation and condensation protein B